MTVCAQAVVRKESSASAQVVIDNSIAELDTVCFKHNAPSPGGFGGTTFAARMLVSRRSGR